MAPKPKRILFVCTGNTCRSPMAEAFFNQEARRAGWPVIAGSAGLSAFAFASATSEAMAAAKALTGADLSAHTARLVSETLMREADVVYGMTRAHAKALRRMFPNCLVPIRILGTDDIPDPYGGTAEEYDKAARAIARAVAQLIQSWRGEDS